MRSIKDRIFHALSFEIVGLILIIPLGSLTFAQPLPDIGVVAFVSAFVATCWNYIYNLAFDHLIVRVTGKVHKTLIIRALHAVLFEAGLLCILLPFIAWYLGASLWQALQMDVSFALFYVVYAFLFNWAYDTLFPIPQPTDTDSA